jgi:hypothetical protein
VRRSHAATHVEQLAAEIEDEAAALLAHDV